MLLGLKFEGDGLLSLMRMFVAGVYVELAIHLLAEFVLRQHAYNGQFDHSDRTRRSHFLRLHFPQSAGISRVRAINLIFFLVTGETDLVSCCRA